MSLKPSSHVLNSPARSNLAFEPDVQHVLNVSNFVIKCVQWYCPLSGLLRFQSVTETKKPRTPNVLRLFSEAAAFGKLENSV